jgi:phosphate transport system substrate-binding protein
VHKDNPLSLLTLAQLDAIFGYEHLRGPQSIRTWGQLGLRGEWAKQPIHLYGFDAYSGSGRFFRHAVLNDSRNMNWDRMREITDRKNRDGSVVDAGRRILDALAMDRFGIAVSNLPIGKAQVKPLALAGDAAGPFVAATKENLISRRYPLVRAGVALINRAPGQQLDPKVREFLRYILSRDGQMDIVDEGMFLPLGAGRSDVQLEKLD